MIIHRLLVEVVSVDVLGSVVIQLLSGCCCIVEWVLFAYALLLFGCCMIIGWLLFVLTLPPGAVCQIPRHEQDQEYQALPYRKGVPPGQPRHDTGAIQGVLPVCTWPPLFYGSFLPSFVFPLPIHSVCLPSASHF